MAADVEIERGSDRAAGASPEPWISRVWSRSPQRGLETLLVSGLAILALIWVQPKLVLEVDRVFPGAYLHFPSDLNGTAWYYWWVHRALSSGEPLLFSDRICAPVGEDLAQIFFSRLDALLAYPFFAAFEFPTSLNLTILTGLWLNIVACWMLFRSLTRWRSLALGLAVLVGYNAYTVGELAMGRPVSGLIFPIPLVLLGWWKVLHAGSIRSALGWGLLTGGAGALAVHLYVPFALFLGLSGVLLLGLQLLSPPPGASRLAGLWALPALVLSGVLLSAPYVYEIQVLRPQMQGWRPGGGAPMPVIPSLWSASFWSALTLSPEAHPGFRPSNLSDQQLVTYRLERMQTRSLPLTWPWKRPMGEDNRRAFLPSSVGAAGLLLTLLALSAWVLAVRRRQSSTWAVGVLSWAGVVGLSYFLSLGPHAVWDVMDSQSWVRWNGARVRMPMGWLIQLWPSLAEIVRPFRVFPVFYVALGCVLALGGEALRAGLGGWLERKGWVWTPVPAVPDTPPASASLSGEGTSAQQPRAVKLLLVVLALCAVLAPLFLARAALQEQTLRQRGLLPLVIPYHVSEIWAELAKEPSDHILMELPTGRAYAYAIPQIIHGLRRSEGVQAMGVERLRTFQPDRCFQHPFQKAIWRLEREVLQEKVAGPPLDKALIADAVADGFSHVLLYPKAYTEHPWQWERLDPEPLVASLTQALGPPMFQDEEVIVFRLGASSASSEKPSLQSP